VLGCWSPYPAAGGSCPGYLLQERETLVLLDCGNGVLSKLQQQVNFTSLDAVIISHLHPDHYLDLYCLRHAWAGRGQGVTRVAPLPLYLPCEPAEVYRKLKSFNDVFDLHAVETLPEHQVQVKDLGFHFYQVQHPLPTYAVKVKGTGCLAYSADTAWQEDQVEWAAGADLCLCEASVLEQDSWLAHAAGHLTARQAGVTGRQARIKRLLLTHFWPEYPVEAVRAEAEEGFGQKVELAREGQIYNL